MRVYMCICVHEPVCVFLLMYVRIKCASQWMHFYIVCMRRSLRTHKHVCKCTSVKACACVYMCVWVQVYMNNYVWIYAWLMLVCMFAGITVYVDVYVIVCLLVCDRVKAICVCICVCVCLCVWERRMCAHSWMLLCMYTVA